MLGMDTYWLVSELLLLVTFFAFLFTLVMMPSKKKVESGVKLVPSWIGIVLFSMLIVTLGAGLMSLLLVDNFFVILLSAVVLAVALILSIVEFFRVKAVADRMTAGGIHHAVEVSQEGLTHHEQEHFHHQYHNHQHMETPAHHPEQAPAAKGPMMTVECPQCGSHIHIPEGSHHITCPYCGLSGTL
jgi:predicted neutral ceramidase superfamily lipid hydrolase